MADAPVTSGRTEAEAAFFEYLALKKAGSNPDQDAFCAARPRLAEELRQLIRSWADIEPLLQSVLAGDHEESLAQLLSPQEAAEPAPTLMLKLGGADAPGPTESAAQTLERLAACIGTAARYRILDQIGCGGMGTILRVRDENLRRNLAMKVVGARDADTVPDEAVLARFLDEALVTGQLDHPGIVPVHELGLDDSGRVYFTMKLVKGSNLRAIFDQVQAGANGWTLNRAVGVILRVCEAVAYAHSKRVIHRDIKPANIMVGRFGETYLMDWGLARVLSDPRRADTVADAGVPEFGSLPASAAPPVESPAGESPAGESPVGESPVGETALVESPPGAGGSVPPDSWLFTRDNRVLGTPVYMSPEQACGDVAHVDERSDIYSLGALLYHLLSGRMPYVGFDETPLPFVVLMRVRRGPPDALRELVPDAPPTLLAICEKAMARNLSDRYAFAADMAADLQDYLEDISEAREEARRQARRAQRINEFLTDMLVSGDPSEAQGRAVTVREVLDRAAAGIGKALPEQAQDEAALRLTIGRLYRELGLFENALPHLQRALALHRELLGPEHEETLVAGTDMALLQHRLGRADAAEALLRETLAAQRRTLGADHRDTLRSMDILATVLQRRNVHLDEAEALRQAALQRREALLGGNHPDTLAALNDLASLMQTRGQHDAAIPLHRRVLDTLETLHGELHPMTLIARNDLANSLQHAGRLQEAEPLYRRALEGQRRVLGEQHPSTLAAMNNLGRLLHQRGQLGEAGDLLSAALAAQSSLLGADHPNTIVHAHNLALLLLDRGEALQAEELLRSCVQRAEVHFSAEHRNTARFRYNLGRCLARLGRRDEARAALVAARSVLSRAVDAEHAWLADAEQALAALGDGDTAT